jgi:glutamate-1-semialdehyde 2,1-aminomutase
MTGFRVHPGGAQALYDISPDLTTMGKVIGGGLPVGAYGGKKEIMEMIAPTGAVYQAGTLSGNPLAVAAGLRTLEIISAPGFFDELNRKANGFFGASAEFVEENNLPLSVNNVNSMGCMYFKPDGVESYGDATGSDTGLFARYFAELLKAGVYIAPSQFEAMFISAAHTDMDLNKTLDKIKPILLSIFG